MSNVNAEIKHGMFAYSKNTLVYVSKIIDGMAYICNADYPAWHKKMPVSKLRPTTMHIST